jgi:hypothetical protein
MIYIIGLFDNSDDIYSNYEALENLELLQAVHSYYSNTIIPSDLLPLNQVIGEEQCHLGGAKFQTSSKNLGDPVGHDLFSQATLVNPLISSYLAFTVSTNSNHIP